MRLKLKKLSEYRFALVNIKGEYLAVFHIDDLWDTEYQRLTKTLTSPGFEECNVTLKLEE